MTVKYPATPTSLAGYQSLYDSNLNGDDLLIPEGAMSNAEWTFAACAFPDYVMRNTGHTACCDGYRVYRKIPVAKQSDAHDREFATSDSPPHLDLRKVQGEPAKAKTYDEGKDPLAYLPWAGVRAVSQVQAYGHKKYKDYNNYRKGMEEGRNLSCAVRHIAAYMEGESLDPESKQSHLAHAACRLLFVLQNQHDKVAIDDRYKK